MRDFKVYQASGVINNFYDQATNVITKQYDTKSGSVVHIDNSIYAPVQEIVVNIEPYQLGSGTPAPDNIRPFKIWHDIHIYVSGADMSEPAIYNVPLLTNDMDPDYDVAGAVVTIKDTGEVQIVATHKCNSFDPDEWSWSWAYYASSNYFRSRTLPTVAINSAYCSILQHAANIGALTDMSIATTGTNPYRVIIRDNSLNGDINLFNQKYVNSDGVILWEQKTPITEQRFGAPEIFTLSGVTNIWSDAGDVSVTYQSI